MQSSFGPIVASAVVEGRAVTVHGEAEPFSVSLVAEPAAGAWILVVRLTAPATSSPGPLRVRFFEPASDVQALWHPGLQFQKAALMPWDHGGGKGLFSSAFIAAPVLCLLNGAGESRVTLACSDVVHPVRMGGFVDEKQLAFECFVDLFTQVTEPGTEFEVRVRVKWGAEPLAQSLGAVRAWWRHENALPEAVPNPDAGRAYYSTWYAFHRELFDQEVLQQCSLGTEYGCSAVLLDDGWEMEKDELVADYLGDWEVAPNRFRDLRAHVKAVHELGYKYLLWCALPFVGPKSRAYRRFQGKYLRHIAWANAYVLDPRFPEVRAHSIALIERLMRDYDLDGLKIDFLESYSFDDSKEPARELPTGEGRDFFSVEEAALKLVADCVAAARAIKPDVLIEFRQSYVGPALQPHCTMIRAHDCAYSAIENRVSTLDTRLLAGDTVVHGDMLAWHAKEPVEAAALQLLNVFFAVPQLSVLFDRLPRDHQEMVRFLVGKWLEFRPALIGGELEVVHPELSYPAVQARSPDQLVVGVFGEVLATVKRPARSMLLLNASHSDQIVLDLKEPWINVTLKTFSCTGQLLREHVANVTAGVHGFSVPRSGVIEVRHGAPS